MVTYCLHIVNFASAYVEPKVGENILNVRRDICAVYSKVAAAIAGSNTEVTLGQTHRLMLVERDAMLLGEIDNVFKEPVKALVIRPLGLEVRYEL